MNGQEWTDKAVALVPAESTCAADDYRRANADIIHKTIGGIGVDSGSKHPRAGVRIVYNLSAAHVGAVLEFGYKNCYALEVAGKNAVGERQERKVSAKRRAIDAAIAAVASPTAPPDPSALHYGALELNGTGVRYYGDMCLVLRAQCADEDTLVLYRNSYDLERPPIGPRIAGDAGKRRIEAEQLAGRWLNLPDMAICKILDGAPAPPRLMTGGMISAALLADEDFMEVPRVKSFGAADIAEMRTSASDVAAEARIADRLARGPTPSLAELLWRDRRREAERAAAKSNIPVRVVTTPGRVR